MLCAKVGVRAEKTLSGRTRFHRRIPVSLSFIANAAGIHQVTVLMLQIGAAVPRLIMIDGHSYRLSFELRYRAISARVKEIFTEVLPILGIFFPRLDR